MSELNAPEALCPKCGHDNRKRQNGPGYLPACVLKDQYFVGRALGRGGFGITYLGYDLNLDRRVAVKEYFPGALATRVGGTARLTPYEDSREAFERGQERALTEGRIIANMGRIPNVVQVHNAFRENGTVYIIMEYIAGETLTRIVKSRGRLDWQYAYRLLQPIMSALNHIHAKGIIHRDISPDNIILDQETGNTVLLDFGAAHPYAQGQGGHTQSLRPGFAPVEQYSSTSAQDGRTDEYALCATFYYLITGEIPTGADQLAFAGTPLKTPRSLGVDIPEAVEKVLLKGMSLNINDRYASLEDLNLAFDIAAVENRFEEDPTRTRPAPPVTPLPHRPSEPPKPAPKGRGWIAAIALAAIILAGLAVWRFTPRPAREPSPTDTATPTPTPSPTVTATPSPTPSPTDAAMPASVPDATVAAASMQGINPGGAIDELAICLSSEPDTLDPALNSAVDGATMVSHLFSGLAKWSQDENGALIIVPDAAEELTEGVVNEDGTVTYTYTLKDGVTWSDGQPVTMGDFEFAWKRAASTELGADYGYMFEQVKGYPDDLAVTATDDKTLEVTLNNAVAYWDELLAFPTYFPVREDVVSDEAWATDPATYISNGAYTMTGWEHNSVITLTKNPYYHDADQISVGVLKCHLSDDASDALANFIDGSWQMIDMVPASQMERLKEEYPTEYKVVGQIGTYYVCWNINEEILPEGCELTGVEAEEARAEIRRAIGLLLDRNYICEEIGQAGQVPASSFVAMGMTDVDGSEFYQNAGPSDEYVGYFDTSADAYESNWVEGVEILKKYYDFDDATQIFTNFPTLTYIYNAGDAHKAIAEYLQGALAGVGIDMQLVEQEWNTFLNTRMNGDYSIARNAWLADYNDPISFLDMWITDSGNNDIQYGRGTHAELAMYDLDLTPYGYDIKVEDGTWAETYDVLISTIKACTDTDARYAMMHVAEDMLMSTGCIVPLYYYTDIFMINDSIQGFFTNPLGYKYFMYATKVTE